MSGTETGRVYLDTDGDLVIEVREDNEWIFGILISRKGGDSGWYWTQHPDRMAKPRKPNEQVGSGSLTPEQVAKVIEWAKAQGGPQ